MEYIVSFLKNKVGNVIPVWAVIFIIVVGTAAGAFLFISNLIDKNVTVTDIPIEIQTEFMEPPYKNETTNWIVNYTINEMSQSSGYIYISIWYGSSITTSEVNIQEVWVEPDLGSTIYGSLVPGYPKTVAANVIDFLFQDSFSLGPIDFSDFGSSTIGNIHIALWFNVTGTFNLQMQLTATI